MSTLTHATTTSDTRTPDDPRTQARTVYPLGWLRGLAALTVVTFHAYQHDRDPQTSAWPLSGVGHQIMVGSDMWVDMFFVLSGLVLWVPVANAVATGGAARSGRMMLYRRLARLLPLYALIVCVVWGLTNPVLPGHWQDLVEHLTFTHIYSNTYIFWTDGPAWSLAVEFHYYLAIALAMPLVFRYARRFESPTQRLAVACALPVLCIALTLGFLVWGTLLTTQDPTNWTLWYGALSRGADFGIGMLLAVVGAAGVRLGARTRGTLAVVGIGATAVLILTRPLDDVAGEWWHLAYALSITVALSSVVLHDGPWPRVLSWRPLAWIGGLGYGIYLVHEPVMRYLDHLGALPAPRPGLWFLVTAVMVAIPAVALAWLSSKTVEAAGLRVLAAWTRDGTPRDYYEHVEHVGQEPLDASRHRGRTSAATASSTSTEPA